MQAQLGTKDKGKSTKQIFDPIPEDPRGEVLLTKLSSHLSLSPLNSHVFLTEPHDNNQKLPNKETTVNLTYSQTIEDKSSKKLSARLHDPLSQLTMSKDRSQPLNKIKHIPNLQFSLPILDEKTIQQIHSARTLRGKTRRTSCMAKLSGKADENDLIIFSFVDNYEDMAKKMPAVGRASISLHTGRTIEVSNNEYSKQIAVYRTNEFKFLAAKRSKSSDFEREAEISMKMGTYNAIEKIREEEVSTEHVKLFAKFLVPNLKLTELKPLYRPSDLPKQVTTGRQSSNKLDDDFSGNFPKNPESMRGELYPTSRILLPDHSEIQPLSHTRRNETARKEWEELINEIQPNTKCIQDEEQPIPQIRDSSPRVATRMTPMFTNHKIDFETAMQGSVKSSMVQECKPESLKGDTAVNRLSEVECRESYEPVVRKQEKLMTFNKRPTIAVSEASKHGNQNPEEVDLSPEHKIKEHMITEFTPGKRLTSENRGSIAGFSQGEVVEEMPAAPMRGEGSYDRKELGGRESIFREFDPAENPVQERYSQAFWRLSSFYRDLLKRNSNRNSEVRMEGINTADEGATSARMNRNTIQSFIPPTDKECASLESLPEGDFPQSRLYQNPSQGWKPNDSYDWNAKPQGKLVESTFTHVGPTKSKHQEEEKEGFVSPFSGLHTYRTLGRESYDQFNHSQVIAGQKRDSNLQFSQHFGEPCNLELKDPFRDSLGSDNKWANNIAKELLSEGMDFDVYNSGYASVYMTKFGSKVSNRESTGSKRSRPSHLKWRGISRNISNITNRSSGKKDRRLPKIPGDFRLKLEKLAQKSEQLVYHSQYASPRVSGGGNRGIRMKKVSRFKTQRDSSIESPPELSPKSHPVNRDEQKTDSEFGSTKRQSYFKFNFGQDESVDFKRTFEYKTTFESGAESPTARDEQNEPKI